MLLLIFVMVFVLYLLVAAIINFTDTGVVIGEHGYAGDQVTHNTSLEII